jgi:hypothetical protein
VELELVIRLVVMVDIMDRLDMMESLWMRQFELVHTKEHMQQFGLVGQLILVIVQLIRLQVVVQLIRQLVIEQPVGRLVIKQLIRLLVKLITTILNILT